MTKKIDSKPAEVLDEATLQLLGASPATVDLPAERMRELRRRVIGSVDDMSMPFLTIHASEGSWVEVSDLVEKKVLSVDAETGIESYLLRIHPGASPEPHQHESDELCLVLEGDVSFDDVHLKSGDFHFARKGSAHGAASTVNGALLFLQAAA